jgi:DNA (cytosine-5)-methyltransferase 1
VNVHKPSPSIEQLINLHGRERICTELGVCPKTLVRWEKKPETFPFTKYHRAIDRLNLDASRSNEAADFTFIDLFAGIGGLRRPFDELGGKCVFTSEWDRFSQQTYLANYGKEHPVSGDITRISESDIPQHDLLLAGFPCQPFSIAGVSKKNALGRAHGFADLTQGTLFFDVARIIGERRPRAFVLENVKNLVSHDRGRTFATIIAVLRDELGYKVSTRILDAKSFVPQHRERILIVGFDGTATPNLARLQIPPVTGGPRLGSILHGSCAEPEHDDGRYATSDGIVNPRYTLTDHMWTYLQNYAAKHRAKGNGFGFGLVGPNDTTRTLSARYYKDGSEILVNQGPDRNPRRLTPRECARLMGFDDSFRIVVSDTQAYRQFGNSVVVPVIRTVADYVVNALKNPGAFAETTVQIDSEDLQPSLFT